MKLFLALVFAAIFALCKAQDDLHPNTHCHTDEDCVKDCPSAEHAVCSMPSEKCHCHEYGEIPCTEDSECTTACNNDVACCHEDHHCHCNEPCDKRR